MPRKRTSRKPTVAAQLAQKKTARAQQAFLEAFGKVATISGAAQLAGVGRRTHYDWLDSDPDYAKRFEDAEAEATDRLEQEARRRAIVGTLEPVYYQGKQVGQVRKYSDTLLMFLLNGRRGEVFKYRHEHTGKGGGPIQTQAVPVDLSKLTDQELDAYIRLQAKLEGREVPA